jgi:hypothetical protein
LKETARLQNLIYRRFLQSHFNPGRVGHVLAMAGRWDAAIDYLETSLRLGIADFRLDLLPATINSMYASDNLDKAASYLTRALSAAFDVNEAEVWYAPPGEKVLRLSFHAVLTIQSSCIGPVQAVAGSRIFASRCARQEEGVVRSFPPVGGSKPLGVVSGGTSWRKVGFGTAATGFTAGGIPEPGSSGASGRRAQPPGARHGRTDAGQPAT